MSRDTPKLFCKGSYEQDGKDTHEHFLFLEVDRGTEHHDPTESLADNGECILWTAGVKRVLRKIIYA
jgi:hypothetical protein